MIYHCPSCKKIIARESGKPPQLSPRSGAVLIANKKEAPKVRCPCGRLIILIKGSCL